MDNKGFEQSGEGICCERSQCHTWSAVVRNKNKKNKKKI